MPDLTPIAAALVGAIAAAAFPPDTASARDAPKSCLSLVERPIARVADEPPAVRDALGPMSDVGGPLHEWRPLDPPPSKPEKRLLFSGRW